MDSSNLEQFKSDLTNIACITLSSKILEKRKDHFSKLCVDVVLNLHNKTDLQDIQIIKHLRNNLNDSYFEEGFLLEKCVGLNMPKRIENARILIVNTPMDTNKIKVSDSFVRVDSVAKVTELELAEKEKMKDKIEKFFNIIVIQIIYDYPIQLYAEKGVMTIKTCRF
ncbi:unnamed protein product [Rotaria sordida]|uniref:Uncharacterized protein n=1 Tax=Rotaria sordida TaxID=392033 RepID=A0A814P4Z7_9BILA|nr:unnamed protein product [Rotaria sordida]